MKKRITPVCVTLFLLLSYSNCQREKTEEKLAFRSLEAFQKEQAPILKANYSPDICEDPQSYSCLQKSFGPDLISATPVAPFPCVSISEGLEICPAGSRYTFDTSEAIANCQSCDEDEIHSRYIFDEFHCYLHKIKVNGLHPVRFESNNLHDSLKGAYETCLDMIGSNE